MGWNALTSEAVVGSGSLMLVSGYVVKPAVEYGVKAAAYGLRKGIEQIDSDAAEYIPQDSWPVFGGVGTKLYNLWNWAWGIIPPHRPESCLNPKKCKQPACIEFRKLKFRKKMSDPVELEQLRVLLTRPENQNKLTIITLEELTHFFKANGYLDAVKTPRGQALLKDPAVVKFFASSGGQAVKALLNPDRQPTRRHDPNCQDPNCQHPDHKRPAHDPSTDPSTDHTHTNTGTNGTDRPSSDTTAEPKKSTKWGSGWWIALSLFLVAVIGVVIWVCVSRKSDSFDLQDCSPA